jgi:hypothetical protein
MSLLSPDLPRSIEPTRHMRNGMAPSNGAYSHLVAALNHVLAYRKKGIYERESILSETSPAPNNWRFRFRTGFGTVSVEFIAVIGLAIELNTDAYVNIALTEEGGATTNLQLHYGGSATAGTGAPEEWSIQAGAISVEPNTAYTCYVTISGGANSLSLCAREEVNPTVDEDTDYFSEFEPTAGAPIFDADIQKLLEGTGDLIQRNRSMFAHWHLVDGAPRTRTNATPISAIDNTLTGTPSSTAAGWRMVTTAHNTYGRDNQVPVEVSVYGSMASGTGTVKLRSTAGVDAVTVNINSATPGWFTATGFITVGSGQLYVPMYAGDGTNQLSIEAISVQAWEA